MIEAITFDLWNTIFNNRFYTEMRLNWFTHFLDENNFSISKMDIENAFKLGFHLPKKKLRMYKHIQTEVLISKMLNILKIDLSNNDKDFVQKEFEEVIMNDPPSLKEGTHTLCSVHTSLFSHSPEWALTLLRHTPYPAVREPQDRNG